MAIEITPQIVLLIQTILTTDWSNIKDKTLEEISAMNKAEIERSERLQDRQENT